jgi:hypothetical protein
VRRTLLSLSLLIGTTHFLSQPVFEVSAITPSTEDKPETVPIVERRLDFREFGYKRTDGHSFDLREYVKDKTIVIINYFAGWCPNSNRNGHVIERVWSAYRGRGLGVVGVAEYSDADELRIHINRIGIDYPVVVETTDRNHRKKSSHYEYRRVAGDKRKWGTPFYVIIDTRDIESGSSGVLARTVYTVSGEVAEAELETFIQPRLRVRERRDL